MMQLHRLFLFGFIGALLGACSSSPSPVLPPVKLIPLKNELTITNEWTRYLDKGAGFAFLKLKPVLNGDDLYSVDHAGLVKRSSLKTADASWEVKLNSPISTPLNLINENLYLGTSKGEVVVLSAESGQEIWRTTLSSEILSSPVASHVKSMRLFSKSWKDSLASLSSEVPKPL